VTPGPNGNTQQGSPNAPDASPQGVQKNSGTGNPGTDTPGGGTQNAPSTN
jgi:hypothetical protein